MHIPTCHTSSSVGSAEMDPGQNSSPSRSGHALFKTFLFGLGVNSPQKNLSTEASGNSTVVGQHLQNSP